MRGRVTAVLVLLVSLSFPVFPECSWTPRYSGQFRTTAYDVSTSGDGFVWVATAYGIHLYDAASPADPVLAGSIAIPGITRAVHAAADGIAYAGSGSRIYVVKRTGTALSVVRAADAGGTVNDIAVSGYLFAATSNGIAHFDVLDPADPIRTAVVLPTTSLAVNSLAIDRGSLYAADGDATVEQFSIAVPALPQHTGTLESLPRSTAVHATPDGLLFVSDQFGQASDVFAGTTRLARLPVGAISFAAGAGNVRFFAGADRTLRAADLSALNRVVDLFELTLPTTGGTENVIHSMTTRGTALYVAAGDLGFVALDVTSLAKPYPLASYSSGATTSVVAAPGRAWFTTAPGTVSEQRIDSAGLALVTERSWEAGAGARVHDVEGTTLLTSSGASATLWNLAPSTPAIATTATFRTTVTAAVIRGNGMIALLADGSVWTTSPSLAQVLLPAITSLARSGPAIALVEPGADEKGVVLRYYAQGDLTATPSTTTAVDGLPIGGIALSPGRAALFTFKGINVIDTATSSVRLIEGSNSTIPRQLTFAGSDLLLLGDRRLFVYEAAAALTRSHPLPADAVAIAAAPPHAAVATGEGMLVVSWSAGLPEPVVPIRSAFYRDMSAGKGRLLLSSGTTADVFATAFGEAPHFTGAIDPAAVVDAIATDDAIWTLTVTGTLTAWSRTGVLIGRTTLDEGPDSQPQSLETAGGAVWVVYLRDCQTSGCVKQTIVVDPATLARTATLSGGAADVAVAGNRAWMLSSLPDEVRVVDITNPLQPGILASAAAPPNARSIAHSTGRVNVLADRVYAYNDATLAAAGTFLAATPPTSLHRLRIAGNCGVVIGRAPSPELFDVRSWTAIPLPVELPSSTRAVALQEPGRLLFLTDHSLEIWSVAPTVPAPRMRGAGR